MDNEFLKLALDAFRNSDFSNVRPTDSVWHPPVWDVEEINQEARRVIDNHVLIEANKARQPFDINRAKDKHLGLPLVGPAGAGKTHILSYVNKRTMAEKGYFVSVNVETLTDFWQTLGSSYLSAFEKPGFDSRPQKVIVAEKIIRAAGLMEPQDVEAFFEKADQRAILDLAFKVSQALFQKKITRGQQPIVNDLIKVLFYLNANDSVMYNNAMLWLQGEMRDDEDFKALELKTLYKDKAEILKALNWLMSLGQSFTVTAFDQLDNILSPHVLGLPESQIFNSEKLKLEYDEAKRILVDLSRNLEIWINSAVSTLSVLAALADGWEKMSYHGTKTSTDRFNSQTFLHPGISGEIGRLLVERRLQEVYKNVPISPPYPSFPFPSKGFDGIVGYTPRDVLKMVELFISKCLEKGQLYECPLSEMKLSEKQGASGPGPEPEPEPEPMPEEIKKIDSRFRTLAAETWQVSNDEFGLYLLALGEALVRGFGRPDHLDLGEDTAPANRKEDNNTIILRYASDPLAPPDRILRMAFIDAEKYQTFQANLKWAVSQSGINPNLSSRKLGLIRFKDFPKGKASQDMLADCQQKGGKWLKPGPKDLAIMAALVTVEEEFSKGVFDEWLRYVHPAMLVEFSKPFFDWLITDDNATDGGSNKPGSSGHNGGHDSQESGSKDRQSEITSQTTGNLPDGDSGAKKQSIEPMVIGRHLNRQDELFTLEPERLLRHLAVFGSSGSGKTVLIKRLVEEAAILGASSVVIDLSGDLSCLGQRWPEPPQGWLPGDHLKAEKYFDSIETVVWTPGITSGNPLDLAPIPDLTLSKDDPDLFKFQKSSARASLMDILKVRSTDTRVEAILSWALDKLAASNDRRLTILSEILLDLPNYENGEEIFDGANAMAEKLGAKLKAAIITDENLKKDNHTDISSLFKPKRKKARISVIYAKELGSTTEQEIFIGNLIMEIFSWLSRNPGPGGLAGLLVIDEAKDLAPSRESTSAKAPIVRYASQARKYGYGLIIASQMFKSIDHNIVGNCDSLFVGRQGSGSAATAAEEMLGIKNKIANLEPTNYAVKVNSVVPNKVNWMKSAMCLSHHPSKAPDRDKILEMAYKSREFV